MLLPVLAVLIKPAAAALLPVRLIACALLGSTAGLPATALAGLGEGWVLPAALWMLAVVSRLLSGVMSSGMHMPCRGHDSNQQAAHHSQHMCAQQSGG